MSRAALCALGLVLCLAGCATDSATPGPVTAAADSFPPPDSAKAPALTPASYQIAPGDTVSLLVFQEAELTRTGDVSPSGDFFVPFLGNMPVAGKTSDQVAKEIAAALDPRLVRNPQVTVSVKASVVDRYTVEGAVTDPGMFNMSGEVTLLQALASAKGILQTADARKVVVFRVIGGQKVANVYDVRDIRTGRASDPKIYANDLIDVPANNSLQALTTALGSVPLFSLLIR